ncbi:MAG: hydrogenase maturation protease [Pseudomonadota bacterium]
MNQLIKLIGVGSPQLNDDIGWQIADSCRQASILQPYLKQKHIQVITLDRPGTRLLPLIADASMVILFDAVIGEEPLTVIRAEDIAIYHQTELLSTHGFGLAETMRLAQALNQLPEKVIFYGISVDPWQALPAGDFQNAAQKIIDQVVIDLKQIEITANVNNH